MPRADLQHPFAVTKSLAEVFDTSETLVIPDYQRAYSWTDPHSGQLTNDLLRSWRMMGRTDGRLDSYFLGSIIVARRGPPYGTEIVDGQQRLITLMIMVAVLRDLLDGAIADRLDQLIRNAADNATEASYRIYAKPRDQRFLETYVLPPGATITLVPGFDPDKPGAEHNPALDELPGADGLTDSQEAIIGNRNLMREALSALSKAERIAFAEFLIEQCVVITVGVDEFDEAWNVFQVLHTRGLPLSFTDVLKAELLATLSEDDVRRCAALWEDAEARLGRLHFVELFRQIYLIDTGKRLDMARAYSSFLDGCQPQQNRVQFISGVLAPKSLLLQQIRQAKLAGFDDNSRVNRLLTYLSWVDHEGWVNAALLWLDGRQRSSRETEQFITQLERFAYGILLLYPNDEPRIESRYMAIVEAIRRQSDRIPAETMQLTAAERREIGDKLRQTRVYGKRFCRPILLRVNAIIAGDKHEYRFRLNQVSAEHVLPQSPDKRSHWSRIFGRGTEAGSAHLVASTFGNLTPMFETDNGLAGAKEFEEKRIIYQRSEFVATREIGALGQWTPKELEQRSKRLAELLTTEWKL